MATAAEELEGMNMIDIRQEIDGAALQAYLQANVEDGEARFGGGDLALKQFNKCERLTFCRSFSFCCSALTAFPCCSGASNPTYFIRTPLGEEFVVRKKHRASSSRVRTQWTASFACSRRCRAPTSLCLRSSRCARTTRSWVRCFTS